MIDLMKYFFFSRVWNPDNKFQFFLIKKSISFDFFRCPRTKFLVWSSQANEIFSSCQAKPDKCLWRVKVCCRELNETKTDTNMLILKKSFCYQSWLFSHWLVHQIVPVKRCVSTRLLVTIDNALYKNLKTKKNHWNDCKKISKNASINRYPFLTFKISNRLIWSINYTVRIVNISPVHTYVNLGSSIGNYSVYLTIELSRLISM